jgi:hypothetical protein
MASKMLMFYIPDDQELLAALGKVTLQNEHLNHILKMTIRSLANLTPQEAIEATQYEGARLLRERIRKLAKQRLGEGQPLLKLQALLTRAGHLTDKRNKLTHGIWAKDLDGDPGIMEVFGELQPLPLVVELDNLASEIQDLTVELNRARLEGFLSVAIEQKKQSKMLA